MSFRYEKRVPGIGPIRKMTGLETQAEFDEFSALMKTLSRTRPKFCAMFRDGEMSALELLLANREERLSELDAKTDPRVIAPLWGAQGAFERAFKRQAGAGENTLKRYRVCVRKLEGLGLGITTVAELEEVDWYAVAKQWKGSPSDYMAMYRMMSAFLTRHFGGRRTGRHSEFRFKVMDLMPRKAERKRVPAISPAVFNRLVGLTPIYAQAVYRALLITGFRMGEYLALTRAHLRPEVFEIEVPGTKTEESAAVVPVNPECWAQIERAVPHPIAYGQIRKHWAKACLSEGLATKVPDPCRPGRLRYKGPTLHDIRHLTAQFMTNEGVPESVVAAYLRHTDIATTRKYTTQLVRAEAANAIARAVGA